MHQAWLHYFKIMQILHLNVMWRLVRRCGAVAGCWCLPLVQSPGNPSACCVAPCTPTPPPPPTATPSYLCHITLQKESGNWLELKKNIKEIQEGAKKPFFWGISDACCERCGCISTSMMVLFQLNWLEPSVWDMCWSQSGFLSHRMYPHFHFFSP